MTQRRALQVFAHQPPAARSGADRVVSAVPPPRGTPKLPREPKTPRVAQLLRQAIEWRALLESGKASNQAAIARREGITRARVTQVLGMLRLAPEIQQHILSMPKTVGRPTISERALRSITLLDDEHQQLQAFADILSSAFLVGAILCQTVQLLTAWA